MSDGNRKVIVHLACPRSDGDRDMALNMLRMDLDSNYSTPSMAWSMEGARIRVEIEFISMDEAVHFAMCHSSTMTPQQGAGE